MGHHPAMLKFVNCCLCSSAEQKPYLTVEGWTLVRCPQCGLIYLNPRPPADRLENTYTSDYFNKIISSDPIVLPTDQSKIKQYVGSQAPRIWQVSRYAVPPGRLLDIGCGPGYFLARARQEGWDAQGLDVSEWAANYAKEHFGIDVRVGTPDRIIALWQNEFDVITMFHVLEHLSNPLASLMEIKQSLRHQGILIIIVPNIGSFEARHAGQSWEGLRLPYHLYHFTPKTLNHMLNKAGFDVLRIYEEPSQLVANWIKRLIKIYHPPETRVRQDGMDPSSLYDPKITVVSKVYAATLGRLFAGRTLGAIARKAES